MPIHGVWLARLASNGIGTALGLAAWDPTGGASGPPGSAPPAPPPRPPPVAVPEEAVEWDDDL